MSNILFVSSNKIVLTAGEKNMPGDNCAVFGCGTFRRMKGIGIWKLPAAKDAVYAKWCSGYRLRLPCGRSVFDCRLWCKSNRS